MAMMLMMLMARKIVTLNVKTCGGEHIDESKA